MDSQATTGHAEPKRKGFKAALGKTFTSVQESAEKLFQDVSQRTEKMRGVDVEPQWRSLFTLPPSEGLLADFPAKLIETDRVVSGVLFVSYHHLCFYSPGTSNQVFVKLTIPFSTVTEMQQAATVPSKTGVPAIVGLNVNRELKPKVLQIFTKENLFVHQLIVSSSLFKRIWTVVDHAYRTSPYIMGPVQSFAPPNSSIGQNYVAPTTSFGQTYAPQSAVGQSYVTPTPVGQSYATRSVESFEQSYPSYTVSQQTTVVEPTYLSAQHDVSHSYPPVGTQPTTSDINPLPQQSVTI